MVGTAANGYMPATDWRRFRAMVPKGGFRGDCPPAYRRNCGRGLSICPIWHDLYLHCRFVPRHTAQYVRNFS